jgi:hypothetical protein
MSDTEPTDIQQPTPVASGQLNLTEQVFERFKSYLNQKVSNLTTNLTGKADSRSKHVECQTTVQQLKLAGNNVFQRRVTKLNRRKYRVTATPKLRRGSEIFTSKTEENKTCCLLTKATLGG